MRSDTAELGEIDGDSNCGIEVRGDLSVKRRSGKS
jgi:hypothetical protein